MEQSKKSSASRRISPWFVAQQVGELGFYIAIPLALLVWLGHWLDLKLGFKALFVIIALPISLGISSYIIYKKIKSIS